MQPYKAQKEHLLEDMSLSHCPQRIKWGGALNVITRLTLQHVPIKEQLGGFSEREKLFFHQFSQQTRKSGGYSCWLFKSEPWGTELWLPVQNCKFVLLNHWFIDSQTNRYCISAALGPENTPMATQPNSALPHAGVPPCGGDMRGN